MFYCLAPQFPLFSFTRWNYLFQSVRDSASSVLFSDVFNGMCFAQTFFSRTFSIQLWTVFLFFVYDNLVFSWFKLLISWIHTSRLWFVYSYHFEVCSFMICLEYCFLFPVKCLSSVVRSSFNIIILLCLFVTFGVNDQTIQLGITNKPNSD